MNLARAPFRKQIKNYFAKILQITRTTKILTVKLSQIYGEVEGRKSQIIRIENRSRTRKYISKGVTWAAAKGV